MARAETGRSSGPHFGGWEIYHVKGSPADPDRVYVSQSGGWFGQLIQRSDDGGRTWNAVGNEFAYEGDAGTHRLRRHGGAVEVRPGLAPRAGARRPRHRVRRRGGRRPVPRSTAAAAGRSWPDCAATAPGRRGSPGRAGCVCTRSCSTRATPARMTVAISAAGSFRTDDAGKSWRAMNQALAGGRPGPGRRGGPLRAPSRDASVAARQLSCRFPLVALCGAAAASGSPLVPVGCHRCVPRAFQNPVETPLRLLGLVCAHMACAVGRTRISLRSRAAAGRPRRR